MADFKTDPIESQGAGTQPVAPVQGTVTPTFDISRTVGSIVDSLGDLAKRNAKDKLVADEARVVKAYLDRERTFVSARDTGQWSPSRVMSASQANYSEFIASNPQYIDSLKKARESVYGGTQTGDIQKEVEADKARKLKEQDYLDEAGMPTYAGKSEETRQAQLKVVFEQKRITEEFKRTAARNSEQRAQQGEFREETKFQQSLSDRESADSAMNSLTTMLSTNFDAFKGMMDDIRNGNMPYDQATALVTSHVAQLKAQAVPIAGTRNQALVGPIMGIFEDLAKTTLEMKKPGAQLDILKTEYETLLLKAKMQFIVDPKTRTSVAGSQLLPQSPVLSMEAGKSVIERLGTLEAAGFDTPIYQIPSTVGNPETEQPTLGIIRGALEKMHQGTTKGDAVKVEKNATTAVNNLLRQTEDIVNRGAGPEKLTNIATFYASPEFGKLAATGKLDNTTMQGAKRAFQAYNQAVVGSVEAELSSASGTPTRGTPAPKIQELVDMSFTGGRVTFVPLGNTERTRDSVAKMKKSEDALTRLVIIGAHMEGTQDYAKYWEKSRHLILPSVYADPERFPAGFVNPSNGWKFKGGAFYNPSNWEKPKDGSKQ